MLLSHAASQTQLKFIPRVVIRSVSASFDVLEAIESESQWALLIHIIFISFNFFEFVVVLYQQKDFEHSRFELRADIID